MTEETLEPMLNEPEDEDIPVIPSNWAEIKPYKRTIVFDDETVIDGYVAKSSISDEIWVYPENTSMGYMEYATIFLNKEKTSRIRCEDSLGKVTEFVGYTRLVNINTRVDGTFAICLTKPIV